MSLLTYPTVKAAPLARSVAVAALLGATFLIIPPTVASADSTIHAPLQLVTDKSEAATAATAMKAETVEQRIESLHTALKITPDQDAKWNAVAGAMRDNAAAMQKMVAEKRAKSAQDMTAVEDMKTYQAFAQAHVDGLKNLNSSFETLYDSMPDAQKKIADRVFQDSNQEASHS